MAARKGLFGGPSVACIFVTMQENGCSAESNPHEIIIGMYLKD
jgi:hypothetical protein